MSLRGVIIFAIIVVSHVYEHYHPVNAAQPVVTLSGQPIETTFKTGEALVKAIDPKEYYWKI